MNIAPPILLGQAFACHQTGRFELRFAALAFLFGAVDHLAIVFANDYADRDADALQERATLVSGGSRVIIDGLLSARAVGRAAAVSALVLLIGSAAAGVMFARPLLPVFAAVALFLLWAYSFSPLRLSYRGYGEMLQGVGVGIVLPLVGWYAQSGELARAPLGALAPLFLLAFAGNVLTALPDREGDLRADKRTWPTRRGDARARRDALVLIGVALALSTQVGPALPPAWRALAVGPPALALLLALTWLRRPALPFVLAAASAGTLLHLGWSVALLREARVV